MSISPTEKDTEKASSLVETPGTPPELQPEARELIPYEQDPRNPWNWSKASRIFHTAVPCSLSFLMTFSTSVTVPATGLIMKEFEVSRTQSLLPLTLYTLGLGFGPLLIAPFSEVWGRKWVYLITTTFLLTFTGGSAAANSFSTLLACRFLAGLLGSAGIAIGAGTVVDVWQLHKGGAQASILFILGPFLGPTLGPLAGASVLRDHGYDWRWTQYLLLIVGAPVWLGCLVMKETSQKWILRNDEGSRRTLNSSQIVSLIVGALVKPTKMLFSEVVVSSLAIYSAFAYAMIFSYFASASYVLPRFYGFDPRQAGLTFISIIIGYVLGGIVFVGFDVTLHARARKQSPDGRTGPEHRLYAGMVGSIFIPAGLFWYAWAAKQDGNWAVLAAAGIPFGLGTFGLFLSVITYMVDFYGREGAASALAANGILRYTLGAVFPLFTFQMYENLGVHWAGSLFAFLSILLLPIPWLLFKFGPSLRQRSKFVTM